jgi:predicted N-acetyltransferase YhbS
MITIRQETRFDVARREALLDEAFAEGCLGKTAERLREDRLPEQGLSFVACVDNRLIGTVRLWNIAAGPGRPGLLLGPLVASDWQRRGIGSHLMRQALEQSERRGHKAILLVGDAPYYGRFGFSANTTGALWLPGPYPRERLLAHELVPDALAGARARERNSRRSSLPLPTTTRPRRGARLELFDLLSEDDWHGHEHECDRWLAGTRAIRWPDRDDRVWLDRQRHAAADRTAHCV